MANALQIFIYIFNKFTDLIFNQLQLVNGVYFGWIAVSIIIFGILINNILNIPNNIRFNKKYEGRKIKSRKGTNTHG